LLSCQKLKTPAWVSVKVAPENSRFNEIETILRGRNLHTASEEAHGPNIDECFGKGIAIFIIIGTQCPHRGPCRDVGHGRPDPLIRLIRTSLLVPSRRCGASMVSSSVSATVRASLAGTRLCPHPDTFKMYEQETYKMDFTHTAASAMVRSSYHADLPAHGAGGGYPLGALAAAPSTRCTALVCSCSPVGLSRPPPTRQTDENHCQRRGFNRELARIDAPPRRIPSRGRA